MSDCQVELPEVGSTGSGEERVRLTGNLDFDSVLPMVKILDDLMHARVPSPGPRINDGSTEGPEACRRLRVELSAVKHANSAGLSLLLEWRRRARARGLEMEFIGVPPQLEQLAIAQGLEALFSDAR